MWAPAKRVEKTENEIIVSTDEGNRIKILIKEALNVHPSCLKGVQDLLMRGDFNESSSLHNIRVRYLRNEIYTAVGTPILISLNPYKNLPIYSSEYIIKYKNQFSFD